MSTLTAAEAHAILAALSGWPAPCAIGTITDVEHDIWIRIRREYPKVFACYEYAAPPLEPPPDDLDDVPAPVHRPVIETKLVAGQRFEPPLSRYQPRIVACSCGFPVDRKAGNSDDAWAEHVALELASTRKEQDPRP